MEGGCKEALLGCAMPKWQLEHTVLMLIGINGIIKDALAIA